MMCDEIGNHSGRIDNFETDKASQSLQLWMAVIHFSFVPVGRHRKCRQMITAAANLLSPQWTTFDLKDGRKHIRDLDQ
jgi:hypothetical protein